MYAMVTYLQFADEIAASDEIAEMQRQADEISDRAGFVALLVIRTSLRAVAIARVFTDPEGTARSLGASLRPDLASQFAAAPFRISGDVVVSRFGDDLVQVR
jgi:hypothetical protein